MRKERDAMEARVLLGNNLLMRILDDMDRSSTNKITAAAFGTEGELRNAAIELSVVKKLRGRINLLAQEETDNV